jgi:glutamate synthase (NADPH/NADH) small chain
VDVPAFVKAFARGDVRTSYAVLRRSNVLPEMCGYVCPACEQCEQGCVERIFTGTPIPIRDIQLAVSQLARRQKLTGVALPAQVSGRRVAVVGGGPAGIACAIRLLEKGHRVTLFEKEVQLGGTPDRLVPDARYPMSAGELEAILEPARLAGRLELRLRSALGRDVSLAALREEWDAVFLAFGLPRALSLGQAAGVVDALSFLRDAKARRLTSVPDRVAVLGGGATALDAALTARQLGAHDTYLVYRRSYAEMPAGAPDRAAFLEAGGHLLILTQPLGYVTDEHGRLKGLRIARTELGSPDESGRRTPVSVPDSESVLEVDLVIEALGQTVPEELRAELAPLRFNGKGRLHVEPDSTFTGTPKVYAGGDLVNGGTTVVQGVTEGMRAADEIDQFLAQRNVPPGASAAP